MRRRIEADDERGRVSLVRHLARPPFAEAQLEWLDDERLRLTFRSPTRATQSSVVLGRRERLRRLLWLIALPRSRVPWAELLAKTYDRQDVGRADEGRKPKPAEVYGLSCPRCEGWLRPVALVLPPKAEALLEDPGLMELHPQTGPPAPSDRPLVLPCAG